MPGYKCPTLCDEDCDNICHEWHRPPGKQSHDPITCESGVLRLHRLMQVREGPDMTVGDVCEGCSDPDNGVWVPVSFCEEAKKDSDYYYEELYG